MRVASGSEIGSQVAGDGRQVLVGWITSIRDHIGLLGVR